MPDFPHYQGRSGGAGALLARGASEASDNMLRAALFQAQRKQQLEDERFQTLLGVSRSDIALYAEDELEKLQTITDRKELFPAIARASQIALARKQQMANQENLATSIGRTTATPGADPSAAVASFMSEATSGRYTPAQVGSMQRDLEAKSVMGQADRAQLTEGRQFEGEQYASRKAAETQEWERRFAKGEASDIAREKRAQEYDDLQARREFATKRANYPWSSTKPPSWEELYASEQWTAQNDGAPLPKEIRVANGMMADRVRDARVRLESLDKLTPEGVAREVIDANAFGFGKGATTIAVPVVTDDGIFSDEVTIENKSPYMARVELARLEQEALADPEGPWAQMYNSLVQQIEANPKSALARAYNEEIPEDQRARVQEIVVNAKKIPMPGERARQIGEGIRGMGAAIVEGIGSPARAQAAGRTPYEKLTGQGERARRRNAELPTDAEAFIEGLTGAPKR